MRLRGVGQQASQTSSSPWSIAVDSLGDTVLLIGRVIGAEFLPEAPGVKDPDWSGSGDLQQVPIPGHEDIYRSRHAAPYIKRLLVAWPHDRVLQPDDPTLRVHSMVGKPQARLQRR